MGVPDGDQTNASRKQREGKEEGRGRGLAGEEGCGLMKGLLDGIRKNMWRREIKIMGEAVTDRIDRSSI